MLGPDSQLLVALLIAASIGLLVAAVRLRRITLKRPAAGFPSWWR